MMTTLGRRMNVVVVVAVAQEEAEFGGEAVLVIAVPVVVAVWL